MRAEQRARRPGRLGRFAIGPFGIAAAVCRSRPRVTRHTHCHQPRRHLACRELGKVNHHRLAFWRARAASPEQQQATARSFEFFRQSARFARHAGFGREQRHRFAKLGDRQKEMIGLRRALDRDQRRAEPQMQFARLAPAAAKHHRHRAAHAAAHRAKAGDGANVHRVTRLGRRRFLLRGERRAKQHQPCNHHDRPFLWHDLRSFEFQSIRPKRESR